MTIVPELAAVVKSMRLSKCQPIVNHPENETFNTLKNQGYHFEHNFGHGKKNLSVVFALLMMLAFLVDQTQQLACRLFQAVLEKEGSRRSLWDHVRSLFYSLEFDSMESIYRALLYGYKVEGLTILNDTS